jgi:hypothetical protein
MRKCIKTRFNHSASKHVFNYSRRSKSSFFEKKILVVWKYAQLHQNTFLTTPDGQKYLFSEHFLLVWNYANTHQNTFSTTPDFQKYL